MPNKYHSIEERLAKMKEGQIDHVRTGPGREGLMTVKKGSPKPQPTILEDLDRRKKSKVIKGVRAVGPVGYN